MTQGCFIQVLPGQLLLWALLRSTSSSGCLLWSPAHSKLWHSWVIRCVLILQGLFTLSCSPETQFCRVHGDVFHEQSPLTPIPVFNAHPHPNTPATAEILVSRWLQSPYKRNRMIYSQVLSFERIPADNILIYRRSSFPSLLRALRHLWLPTGGGDLFCLVFYESCKVGVWGNLCFLTAPSCVCSSLLRFGTTIANYSLSFV